MRRFPVAVWAADACGRNYEGNVDRSYDADYWRKHAEETRAKAEAMYYFPAKRELLLIAECYERLAEHAARTAGRKAPRSRG
jgi:hypothetical protein